MATFILRKALTVAIHQSTMITAMAMMTAVLPEEAQEIELVGLVSNICVVSNAVVLQSRYPEATIVVDAACTDSFDKALHQKVLDVLEGFQVKVIGR